MREDAALTHLLQTTRGNRSSTRNGSKRRFDTMELFRVRDVSDATDIIKLDVRLARLHF